MMKLEELSAHDLEDLIAKELFSSGKADPALRPYFELAKVTGRDVLGYHFTPAELRHFADLDGMEIVLGEDGSINYKVGEQVAPVPIKDPERYAKILNHRINIGATVPLQDLFWEEIHLQPLFDKVNEKLKFELTNPNPIINFMEEFGVKRAYAEGVPFVFRAGMKVAEVADMDEVAAKMATYFNAIGEISQAQEENPLFEGVSVGGGRVAAAVRELASYDSVDEAFFVTEPRAARTRVSVDDFKRRYLSKSLGKLIAQGILVDQVGDKDFRGRISDKLRKEAHADLADQVESKLVAGPWVTQERVDKLLNKLGIVYNPRNGQFSNLRGIRIETEPYNRLFESFAPGHIFDTKELASSVAGYHIQEWVSPNNRELADINNLEFEDVMGSYTGMVFGAISTFAGSFVEIFRRTKKEELSKESKKVLSEPVHAEVAVLESPELEKKVSLLESALSEAMLSARKSQEFYEDERARVARRDLEIKSQEGHMTAYELDAVTDQQIIEGLRERIAEYEKAVQLTSEPVNGFVSEIAELETILKSQRVALAELRQERTGLLDQNVANAAKLEEQAEVIRRYELGIHAIQESSAEVAAYVAQKSAEIMKDVDSKAKIIARLEETIVRYETEGEQDQNSEEIISLREKISEYAGQVTEMEARLDANRETIENYEKNISERAKEFQDRVATLKQGVDSTLAQKDNEIMELRENVSDYESQVAQRDEKIVELSRRIEEIEQRDVRESELSPTISLHDADVIETVEDPSVALEATVNGFFNVGKPEQEELSVQNYGSNWSGGAKLLFGSAVAALAAATVGIFVNYGTDAGHHEVVDAGALAEIERKEPSKYQNSGIIKDDQTATYDPKEVSEVEPDVQSVEVPVREVSLREVYLGRLTVAAKQRGAKNIGKAVEEILCSQGQEYLVQGKSGKVSDIFGKVLDDAAISNGLAVDDKGYELLKDKLVKGMAEYHGLTLDAKFDDFDESCL